MPKGKPKILDMQLECISRSKKFQVVKTVAVFYNIDRAKNFVERNKLKRFKIILK